MTSISAGERRAKGRNKGRNKERGCPVHSTNVVGGRGGGEEGGDFFSLPGGRFFFGGAHPTLTIQKAFPTVKICR
jgi:hypothetical protein